MEFNHVSVLLDETIESLQIKKSGIYVDGTLGGAGHSMHIARQLDDKGTLIGIDRDTDALDASSSRLSKYACKKIFVHSNYSQIKTILADQNIMGIDGAILDLGVSSFQLDNTDRGFSYMHDAPLDMRMNREDSFTAEDVVNNYSELELARIIKKYSDEKWASRIAKFIVNNRVNNRITRTGELVEIIKAAIPMSARRDGPHPAKRTFQAIRIEVNDEIGKLERAVEDFCDCLLPGGRLAIITFHSLEDGIVKRVFARRENPCVCPSEIPICVCGLKPDVRKITRKPIIASKEELEINPRARSAKLRVIEKL